MSTVIKVENLSKQYRLGIVGTGTVAHDAQRWWAKVRGKEDPFLKIGGENIINTNTEGDYIWSLKDINFEVQSGEALGIIGKNGAGKSTLLKILSKVTAPTKGSVKIRGRIASLLEVGTGFHPELTGRENVFLNGAILGMTKQEIKSKFDEIVDFSGIEKYIDTPVKRYSSGMYVRLAFGVAAHLEPEILIIDEVLAVGDAEFQKRCLGKMKAVAGDGRTVLFVSHAMDSVRSLCTRCIYLKNGEIFQTGNPSEIINNYLKNDVGVLIERKNASDENIEILEINLIDKNSNSLSKVFVDQEIGIYIKYKVLNKKASPIVNIDIYTTEGAYIISSICNLNPPTDTGVYESTVWIPANILNNKTYSVGIGIFTYDLSMQIHFYQKDAIIMEVYDSETSITRTIFKGTYGSMIRPIFDWNLKKIG